MKTFSDYFCTNNAIKASLFYQIILIYIDKIHFLNKV